MVIGSVFKKDKNGKYFLDKNGEYVVDEVGTKIRMDEAFPVPTSKESELMETLEKELRILEEKAIAEFNTTSR